MKHLLPPVPKYFKASLHTHSTVSDGRMTPEECWRRVMELNPFGK